MASLSRVKVTSLVARVFLDLSKVIHKTVNKKVTKYNEIKLNNPQFFKLSLFMFML